MSRTDKPEPFELLGRAVNDYFTGENPATIKVCSSLWKPQDTDPAIFFRDFDHMPTWEQKAMGTCRGRTLDIGAGAGAHSIHLQNIGLEVKALELSTSACRVMTDRGVKDVVNGDIFGFRDDEKFDTILLLMNGTGIARTLSKLPVLLAKCRHLMRPGAQILVDSTDIIYMYEEEDGNVWLNLNSEYYGEVNMWIEYKGVKSKKTSWLYADPTVLEIACEESGLKMELIFQDAGGQYLARLT